MQAGDRPEEAVFGGTVHIEFLVAHHYQGRRLCPCLSLNMSRWRKSPCVKGENCSRFCREAAMPHPAGAEADMEGTPQTAVTGLTATA